MSAALPNTARSAARTLTADSLLEALLAHARRRPDAPALRADSTTVSYATLLENALDLADRLERARVEVIGVALDNGPDWAIVDLAAQIAQIAVVPVPAFFAPSQIGHVLRASGADALVTAAAAPGLSAATARTRLLAPNLALVPLESGDTQATRVPLPRHTSKVSYTSGTTGQPRGVCLAQATLDGVARSVCDATASLGLRRHLAALPLATLLENVAGLYAPLMQGSEILLPRLATLGFDGAAHFDVRQFLTALASYRPDSVILLPQMLTALVTAIEQGAETPDTLRFVAVGGGRVARSLLERADRLGLPVYEGYGLTECGSVVALNTPEARRAGSVGRPLAHARIAIGPDSEVRVAGSVMLGYADEAAPAPREIATGDLGHLDTDGFLFLDGRRKNIFITSYGRNVAPEWIEAELVQQPHIAQAAVFGEARPWNAAILVPRRGALPAGPGRADDSGPGASAGSPAPAAADTALMAALAADVAAANARLPAYARVGRWLVADAPFTPDNGLVTPNGRNRRDALGQAYAQSLETLWSENA